MGYLTAIITIIKAIFGFTHNQHDKEQQEYGATKLENEQLKQKVKDLEIQLKEVLSGKTLEDTLKSHTF